MVIKRVQLKEQRKHPRREVYIPVFYKMPSRPQASNWVLTKDISESGLRFQADTGLRTGTKLKLEIDIPGRLFLMLAEGKVMWTKDIKKPGRQVSSKTKEIGIKVDISSPLEAKLWSKFIQQQRREKLDELIEKLEQDPVE